MPQHRRSTTNDGYDGGLFTRAASVALPVAAGIGLFSVGVAALTGHLNPAQQAVVTSSLPKTIAQQIRGESNDEDDGEIVQNGRSNDEYDNHDEDEGDMTRPMKSEDVEQLLEGVKEEVAQAALEGKFDKNTAHLQSMGSVLQNILSLRTEQTQAVKDGDHAKTARLTRQLAEEEDRMRNLRKSAQRSNSSRSSHSNMLGEDKVDAKTFLFETFVNCMAHTFGAPAKANKISYNENHRCRSSQDHPPIIPTKKKSCELRKRVRQEVEREGEQTNKDEDKEDPEASQTRRKLRPRLLDGEKSPQVKTPRELAPTSDNGASVEVDRDNCPSTARSSEARGGTQPTTCGNRPVSHSTKPKSAPVERVPVSDEKWVFKHILDHKPSKGRPKELFVEWETGETTWEDFDIFSRDATAFVEEYAENNDLLDKWSSYLEDKEPQAKNEQVASLQGEKI